MVVLVGCIFHDSDSEYSRFWDVLNEICIDFAVIRWLSMGLEMKFIWVYVDNYIESVILELER